MTDRRTEILDAALILLAEHGMRGLTHRAVDSAAGIPPGSTSYYFRSRHALVAGCVDRLVELDLAVDAPTASAAAADLDTLADAITGIAVHMTTAGRHRTLARYELSLAAVRDPQMRAVLAAGGDTIRRTGARLLAALGAANPDQAAAEIAAVLDGLVFTAMVRGPHQPDALAAEFGPALRRALLAQPGLRQSVRGLD